MQSILNALGQVGNEIFGSVAQTFSSGIPAVNSVDTSFDGDRFTLEINRQSGSSTTLDSERDGAEIVTEYTPASNPVTNRPAVDGYISRGTTGAAVFVEWSNTDYTDYMAGGYWLHIGTGGGVEAGAFIDGPNYDSDVTVPVTGTAEYNGRAAGFYVVRYGQDAEALEEVPGDYEYGEYAGELMLIADFGDGSISGEISNIELNDEESSDFGITIGSTTIRSNGQFEGDDIELTHPDFGITDTSGSWAGRFSTEDDNSGHPRAVAGTHKGYGATQGRSEAIFIGAQYGVTGQFQ